MHPQWKVMKAHKTGPYCTIDSYLASHMRLLNACIHINNTAFTSFVTMAVMAVCFPVRCLPQSIMMIRPFKCGPRCQYFTPRPFNPATQHFLTRCRSEVMASWSQRIATQHWLEHVHSKLLWCIWEWILLIFRFCINMDGRLLPWSLGVLLVSL